MVPCIFLRGSENVRGGVLELTYHGVLNCAIGKDEMHNSEGEYQLVDSTID